MSADRVIAYCLRGWFIVALIFIFVPIVISFIFSQRENAMIAHGAHLGGAVTGIALTLILRPESFGQLLDQIARQFG